MLRRMIVKPTVPSRDLLATLPNLKGLIDLQRVVVVVGFGEVGPWGNARTRWEMEAYGEFSMEGCIELAWLTGRIKYHNGPLKGEDNTIHIGWVDSITGEAVQDSQVKSKYEDDMLLHAGIRVVEPDLFEGYDPFKKVFIHQVAIDRNMSPIEVPSKEEAEQYRRELGADAVDVYEEAGVWFIRLRRGAVLSIPKAMKFNRYVAGQIPTGWAAENFGIPKDIAESVDPATLFALVSVVEALVSAGVCDPYEFYQYIHLSQVGNCVGSGMGGLRSLNRIYHLRRNGAAVPNDSLQECFINTIPAWINMLLLSSCGPIKTPVGACATAAESVEIGVETILSKKARVVLVGGVDDFDEVGSYEFAQMGATADSEKETAKGRLPREMSRPCSSTRGGFVESQGAGVQILMDAQLALDMGCPIYAIVALTNTAMDKTGRSVPAPGQGILSTAREEVGENRDIVQALLNVEKRSQYLQEELEEAEEWMGRASKRARGRLSGRELEIEEAMIVEGGARRKRAAQATWGQDFYHGNPGIAPLRGALAVWGLTPDDVSVASFHGTVINIYISYLLNSKLSEGFTYL